MAMLHLVNKSPYDTCSLNTASTIMKDGDQLLLIEDGIYGAMKNGKAASLLKGLKVAVLGPDLALLLGQQVLGQRETDGAQRSGLQK